MAKKKQDEAPKGSPAWMATFSDLMNLLLCFFVLLFSMSTVDAEKFEQLIASLQSSFSVLPSGGSSVGEGEMISSGVSALEQFNVFFETSSDAQSEDNKDVDGASSANQNQDQNQSGAISEQEAEDLLEQKALEESEKMAENIEDQAKAYGIQDQVEVDFNAQYVLITLNGALLFDSGEAAVRTDALPLVDKIGAIVSTYTANIIDVEGHTDNVPIKSSRYEDNDVLSMYRALYVANRLRSVTTIESSHIKSSGRGEYIPIADNGTQEGRARNRRVEIKIYNSYNSDGIE